MAVYGVDIRTGLARNGVIPFTGWTPSLGIGSPKYGSGDAAGQIQFNGQTQNDDRLAKQFRKVGLTNKVLRQMLINYIGGAVGVPGTGAGNQYKWVLGTTGDNYRSLRQIEITNVTNRTMNAADQAALRGMFSRTVFPATYPRDVSGNGGGGKVKF